VHLNAAAGRNQLAQENPFGLVGAVPKPTGTGQPAGGVCPKVYPKPGQRPSSLSNRSRRTGFGSDRLTGAPPPLDGRSVGFEELQAVVAARVTRGAGRPA
jgi:hypothetical protein